MVNMGIFAKLAKTTTCRILDLIYPRLCACCRAVITTPDSTQICQRCQAELPLIDSKNKCNRCSLPLGAFAKERNHCEGCYRLPFAGFRRAVAVGTYEGALAKLLRVYKYAHQPFLIKTFAPLFTDLLMREFKNNKPAIVTGVPLFKARLKRRGFDQAQLLAGVATRALNIPHHPAILERVKNTPTLTRLSRTARAAIIKGAFKVNNPELIKNADVLLVDDIMTTAATVSECARTLKAAGARKVSVAVLARTP